MQIGDFELHLLEGGRWKMDGGACFAEIPKLIWEKQKPADGNNQVDLSCVCAVARLGGKVIVCETGIGTKLPEKRARQVVLRQPELLLTGLRSLGIRPDEVDVVVSSHLHWDHTGGYTTRGPGGTLELTFPKAKHFVQRAEWDFALAPDPRSQAGYIPDDFGPVEEAGLLEFVDGDAEVIPGLELRLTGGHTPGHQVVLFRSGELACAFAGDLIPVRPHLQLPWNNSADLDVPRVMQEKARLLDEAERHRWLLVLGHEVDGPAGYLGAEGEFRPESSLAATGLDS